MSTCFDPRFRAGAAMGLAEIEMVCLRGGRVFSPPEWTHFEFGYLVYRAGLNKMGAIALEKKQTRWRQRPKGHGLEHLVYDFHGLNPRYCSNFLDEDFVRRSKKLAIQSNARFVSKHVLFRYAIAATLRWTDLKPEWEKTCCVCTVRHGSNTQSADNIDGKRDPPNHIQCGAPKIAKLVYNSSNYDLRYL